MKLSTAGRQVFSFVGAALVACVVTCAGTACAGIAAGKPLPLGIADAVPSSPKVDEYMPQDRAPQTIDLSRKSVVTCCTVDGDGAITGVVSLQVGRAGRKGHPVTVSWTGLDGRSAKAKCKIADLSSGSAALDLDLTGGKHLSLAFSGAGADAVQFSGDVDGDEVVAADVGGLQWNVGGFRFVTGFAETIPAGPVAAELLPVDQPVWMMGSRWSCQKASRIAYKKDRRTGQMGWVVDNGKGVLGEGNVAKLKLRYSAKAGTFKGTFLVYSLVKGKLESVKATVTGVVVDGVGYGQVSVPKVGTWPVRVM